MTLMKAKGPVLETVKNRVVLALPDRWVSTGRVLRAGDGERPRGRKLKPKLLQAKPKKKVWLKTLKGRREFPTSRCALKGGPPT